MFLCHCRSKTKSPSPGGFGGRGGGGRGGGGGDERRLFDPRKPLPTSFSVGAELSTSTFQRRPSTPSQHDVTPSHGGGGGRRGGIITLPTRRTPSPSMTQQQPHSLPPFPHPADRRSHSPPGMMRRTDHLMRNRGGRGMPRGSYSDWRGGGGPRGSHHGRDNDDFMDNRRGGGYDQDSRDYNHR